MTVYNQKPILGQQIKKGHPIAQGLVGCWVMNEGSGDRIIDSSGNNHNGAVIGADWAIDGLDFDGTNDYVEIPNPGSILDNKGLSIIAEICWDADVNLFPRIVDRVYDGQFAFYFIDSGNEVSWALNTANGDVDYASASSAVALQGIWAQYCLTYDKTTAKIYIDASLKDSSSAGIGGGLDSSTDNITIGDRSDGTTRKLNGKIRYVYIYDRALTASEIEWLHCEPYAMFEDIPIWMMYQEAAGGLSIPRPLSRPFSGPLGGI